MNNKTNNPIITYLEKNGYKTINTDYYSAIQNWLDWYTCTVDEFHKNSFWNGRFYVDEEILQLGMAKTVSEDWANLILNEKVDINIGTDSNDEQVMEVLKKNKFFSRANQLVEKAFALGTGAFVTYLNNNEVKIDYVTANNIYPLSWNKTGITECAFGSVEVSEGTKKYYVQIHKLNARGNYDIENHVFRMEEDNIKEEILENIVPVYDTKSNIKNFHIITPNIANNYDIDNPMGISVYANAVDVLKVIDTAFDSMNNDFITARRIILAKLDLFGVDENGNTINVVNSRDRLVRWLGESEDGDLLKDFSPDLRIKDHIDGIQFQLNLLSEKCGMGTNRYQFGSHGVKTATEVISEDSDLYQTLKKHEIVLGESIVSLIQNIAFLLKKNISEEDITINFDDSIIQDENAIKTQAMQEYNASLIDEVEYFKLTRGFTDEQSIQFVEDMQSRVSEPKEEPNVE